MRFSCGRVVLLAICGLGFLVGCAGTGSVSGEAQKSAAQPPEEIVAKRAQERWDALVKRDFDQAFGYISPSGRLTLPKEVFAGRLTGTSWLSATVDKIKCEAELCNVSVKLRYHLFPNFPHVGIFEEKWILEDANWWLVYQG